LTPHHHENVKKHVEHVIAKKKEKEEEAISKEGEFAN